MERTRAQWEAFAGEHDCCLEPVLDLDEALDSELVQAREMVVELDQPGATETVRLLGVPVKLSAHARRHRRSGPARRSASTPPRCSRAAGYSDEEIARAPGVRRGRRARRRTARAGASWRERDPAATC